MLAKFGTLVLQTQYKDYVLAPAPVLRVSPRPRVSPTFLFFSGGFGNFGVILEMFSIFSAKFSGFSLTVQCIVDNFDIRQSQESRKKVNIHIVY